MSNNTQTENEQTSGNNTNGSWWKLILNRISLRPMTIGIMLISLVIALIVCGYVIEHLSERIAKNISAECEKTRKENAPGESYECSYLGIFKASGTTPIQSIYSTDKIPTNPVKRDKSNSRQLSFCGSDTMGRELVPNLIQKFNQKYPEQLVKPEIKMPGSLKGLDDMIEGKCEIAMSSHQLSPIEINDRERKGNVKLDGQPVGLDGIAVIVHRENPVQSISLSEVAAVYQDSPNRISDWGKLHNGRSGEKIKVMALDDQSGTRSEFEIKALSNGKITVPATLFSETNDISNAVANDTNAIGFVSLRYKGNTKPLPIYRDDSQPCQLPNESEIRNESYPLFRRLYLYSAKNDGINKLADKFIEFTISEEGQKVVVDSGFFSTYLPSPKSNSELFPPCFRKSLIYDTNDDYQHIQETADKLQVFKFRSCSDRLDDTGNKKLNFINTQLRTPKYIGKTVYILGFADSLGSDPLNMLLSEYRAKVISEGLNDPKFETTIEKIKPMWFGKKYAIVKDENMYAPSNREFDRRVEVWISKH